MIDTYLISFTAHKHDYFPVFESHIMALSRHPFSTSNTEEAFQLTSSPPFACLTTMFEMVFSSVFKYIQVCSNIYALALEMYACTAQMPVCTILLCFAGGYHLCTNIVLCFAGGYHLYVHVFWLLCRWVLYYMYSYVLCALQVGIIYVLISEPHPPSR